eukprot:856893-Rhodomonas_salina.2
MPYAAGSLFHIVLWYRASSTDLGRWWLVPAGCTCGWGVLSQYGARPPISYALSGTGIADAAIPLRACSVLSARMLLYLPTRVPTPQNQIQETTFLVQIVLERRFLEFDFGPTPCSRYRVLSPELVPGVTCKSATPLQSTGGAPPFLRTTAYPGTSVGEFEEIRFVDCWSLFGAGVMLPLGPEVQLFFGEGVEMIGARAVYAATMFLGAGVEA